MSVRKPMRRRRKGSLALAKQKADKAWAFRVKDRAAFSCEICGKTGSDLNAHHVVPRTVHRLRHSLANGCALCYRHHIHFAHQHSLDFAEWFKKTRPDDYAYIMEAKNREPIHRTEADYLEIAASLAPESEGMEDAA